MLTIGGAVAPQAGRLDARLAEPSMTRDVLFE
jgi:hypothetical protein